MKVFVNNEIFLHRFFSLTLFFFFISEFKLYKLNMDFFLWKTSRLIEGEQFGHQMLHSTPFISLIAIAVGQNKRRVYLTKWIFMFSLKFSHLYLCSKYVKQKYDRIFFIP